MPVTHRIQAKALELLEKNPEGIRWTDLNSLIMESGAAFHSKTENGTVRKPEEKFPHQIYTPEKGLFRLTKYRVGNTRDS